MSILTSIFFALLILLGTAGYQALRRKSKGLNYCPVCARRLITREIGGRIRIACPTAHWVHWDNPKPVVIVLVPLDGKLVLVRRKFAPAAGSWALPGGFIEALEHPADAAAREVLEETGLKVEIIELLDVLFSPSGSNELLFFYLASSATGTPVAGDDASDVRVFAKDELPEIAFSTHRRMVLRWFEQLEARSSAVPDKDTGYQLWRSDLTTNRAALTHAMAKANATKKELAAAINLKRADAANCREAATRAIESVRAAAAALDQTIASVDTFSRRLHNDGRSADFTEALRVRKEADLQRADILALLATE